MIVQVTLFVLVTNACGSTNFLSSMMSQGSKPLRTGSGDTRNTPHPIVPPRPTSDKGQTRSVSQSTPMRTSSSNIQSQCFSSPPVSQETLKKALGQEIGEQMWQFPCDTFSRMVCHRVIKSAAAIKQLKTQMRLRSEDKIDRLVYYDCDSDRTWFLTAVDAAAVDLEGKWHDNSFPVTGLKSVHYEPLALLLNLCLEA